MDQRCPMGFVGSYISATVVPSKDTPVPGPPPPAVPKQAAAESALQLLVAAPCGMKQDCDWASQPLLP